MPRALQGSRRAVVSFSPLLVLSLLSGCSFSHGFGAKLFGSSPKTGGQAAQSTAKATAEPTSAVPTEAPIDLTVAQAFYDGPKLRLKIRLDAKSSVRTDEIVVSVAALRDGQTVEVHDQRLADIVPFSRLDAGESAVVPFTLDSDSLSEYQVALRWGDDAKEGGTGPFHLANGKGTTSEHPAPAAQDGRAALAAQPGPEELELAADETPVEEDGDPGSPIAVRISKLDRVETQCDEPPCEVRFTVHATILNKGRSQLNGLRVATGFIWVEEGATAEPPPSFEPARKSEAVVDLYQLTIPANAERKLKIKVDRSVPVIPGGEFRPYLRIVDAL